MNSISNRNEKKEEIEEDKDYDPSINENYNEFSIFDNNNNDDNNDNDNNNLFPKKEDNNKSLKNTNDFKIKDNLGGNSNNNFTNFKEYSNNINKNEKNNVDSISDKNELIHNINNYDFNNFKNSNSLDNSINNVENQNNQIIKNEINNDINDFHIYENTSLSQTFKRKIKDNEKKVNNVLEFENIELPQEEENGDFTEINCPYIKNAKKEEQEKKNDKNKQEGIFQSFFNNNTFLKNSLNNNYLNFFNKNQKDKIEPDSQFKTTLNLQNKNNKINLVQTMAVLKSSNNQTWKDNLKSLVSSLYYNSYGILKKFDKEMPILPLNIFDKELDVVIPEEINKSLKSFLYMSYRSGFINLNCIGSGDYTSDCGWGCMLRCSQMILSKGLIQKKIFDFYQRKNSNLDYNTLENIRKQTLSLFNDNYLPFEEVRDHPDFHFFWDLYKGVADENPEYNSISEVIPPYSIHILCKLGKFAGVYTSDIKMIKLFCKINSEIFNDLNIVFFESGYISKKKLISNFCEKYTKFNHNIFYTITYNNEEYIFKKGGIVFISFRLGLYDLDSSYYNVIPLLFKKFQNNLGFISGKKNRAYYFIGIQGNNSLIFADPHYNQYTTNSPDRDYESYYTDNLYLMDIKDLSSELTLGIAIFNSSQFTQFLDELNWFKENLKGQLITFVKDE